MGMIYTLLVRDLQKVELAHLMKEQLNGKACIYLTFIAQCTIPTKVLDKSILYQKETDNFNWLVNVIFDSNSEEVKNIRYQ